MKDLGMGRAARSQSNPDMAEIMAAERPMPSKQRTSLMLKGCCGPIICNRQYKMYSHLLALSGSIFNQHVDGKLGVNLQEEK